MKQSELAQSLRRLAFCENMEVCEACPFDQEVCRSEDTGAILLDAAELLDTQRDIKDAGTQGLGKVLSDRLSILRADAGMTYKDLLAAMSKYFYTDEYGSKHLTSRASLVGNELDGGRKNRGCERIPAELLVWYANVFGVSVDWLLGRTDRRD